MSGNTARAYLKELLSSESPASSKRFVTLMMAFHLALTSIAATFFCFYLILFTPRGTVNLDLLKFLGDIVYYDVMIVLGGLGFVTAEGVITMFIERMKIKAAANVATGTPTTETINVDTVNVDQSTTEAKPVTDEDLSKTK